GRGLRRRALSLALAAALVLALSVTAYAAWNIHAARQQALKEDLQIEEHHADSYVEYDTADAQEGLVLLSAVNDGESQRVYVNVSPVEKDVIKRFPEIAFAWKLDGMTLNGEDYWMTAAPKLKAGRSVSGHDAIYEAVLEDAYDESTKTLTLECFISNNAIAQAQAYENGEYVHLTITLWDHQAQADAEVGRSAEWLEKQKSFGSVWFAPTESEMRRFDFGNRLYHDTETDKTIEMVGESDYEFVVKAAKKFNYDFFVLGGEVVFRAAKSDPSIYMEIGPDDGLLELDVGYDITGFVEKIEVRNVDPGKGKLIKSKSSISNTVTPIVSKTLYKGMSHIYIDPTASSDDDAGYRAKYLVENSSYHFGSMKAQMIGMPDLVPGKFYKIADMGDGVSNKYYVTNVRHHMMTTGDFKTTLTGIAATIESSGGM
ncbi:MAG: hypothetical protein II754_02970, partial [Lachnospiraceae bacterium]|nr:hypothetical protein [Lachnospiraceae bacterium]